MQVIWHEALFLLEEIGQGAFMIYKAFDHAFVGDNQNSFSRPSAGCRCQRFPPPFPNALVGFAARRTKIPLRMNLFCPYIRKLHFKLSDCFSGPVAPVLFPKPGIQCNRKFQRPVDQLGCFFSPAEIAGKDPAPGIPCQNPSPLQGQRFTCQSQRAVELALNPANQVPFGYRMAQQAKTGFGVKYHEGVKKWGLAKRIFSTPRRRIDCRGKRAGQTNP